MRFSSSHIFQFFAILIFSFYNNINGFTQSLEISAAVDRNNISSDDYIRYTIQTNNKVTIDKTNFSDFNLLQGPFTSTSSSVSIINGKIDKKEKYTFTYILSPAKTGQLKIGPASATYNGKSYTSNSININVRKGNRPINSKEKDVDNSKIKNTSHLFARINLNKNKVYKGESILVTYKIYTRYNSLQVTDYDFPLKDGLWVEELKYSGNGWPQKREVINGVAYSVLTLRKEIVIPQVTGEIKFPEIKLKALVNQSIFGWGSEINFKSNSPKLNVISIPKKGRPTSFSGQVGSNYQLDVSLSTNEINIDEPIDLNIKISGNGNINHLEIPTSDFPKMFDVYPPESKDNINITSNGVSGSKEVNYILIPRHYGKYVIPAINFSYFDPKKRRFIKLNYKEQQINVLKNGQFTNNQDPSSSSYENNSSITPQKIKILNKDIRHIEHESELKKQVSAFYGTISYWFLLLLPPLLLFTFLLFYRYKSNNTDHDFLKRKNAGKKLEKKFAIAEKHLKVQDQQKFYDELYRSWIHYISLKFKLPVSQLNKQTIKTTLNQYSLSEEYILELENILQECEMAQYAPFKEENANLTFQKSKKLIHKIEKHVKI